MAIIIRTPYTHNIAQPIEPLLYIDQVNRSGYIAEMYGIVTRYLRDTLECEIELNTYMADNIEQITFSKDTGYWVVEHPDTVTLYEKTTPSGILYNGVGVEKVFSLSAYQCPRVVPRVVPRVSAKSSPFDNLKNELFHSVTAYMTRTPPDRSTRA